MAANSAQPMSFDAANAWLKSRVDVPTDLSSRELALAPEFDARVRMHAFFSARVDSANVLDALRGEVAQFAAGDADLATARWRIKTALARQGYAADDVGMTDAPPAGMDEEEWQKRRAITNLASTRRLNLILTQNARMAWALGRKEVSEDPAVLQRWPNYRYIARDGARSTHAALNGMVLPKLDPFWHTHTPPWEFFCRCDIEDEDGEATGRATTTENPDGSQTARIVNPAAGAAGAGVEIPPSPSGFVFRSDEALRWHDLSRVRDPQMRDRIANHIANEFGDLVSVVDGHVAFVGETGRKIAAFYDQALANPGTYDVLEIAPVSGRARELIEQAHPDWDMDGYVHAVNSHDLRHTHNRHVGKNEKRAGNVPMTREDIKRMAMVMEHPDYAESGGRDSVKMYRHFPGGRLCATEIERSGNRQEGKKYMMQKTMWKNEPDHAQHAADAAS